MLNRKEKIIKLKEQGDLLLHIILKGVSWCMYLACVFFWLAGILFFITGDQNIFLYKRSLQ